MNGFCRTLVQEFESCSMKNIREWTVWRRNACNDQDGLRWIYIILTLLLDVQCAKNHDGHCGYDCSLMFFRACSDLGPANAGYQHCKNSRMQSWSLAQEAISLGFIAIDPEGIACVAMASTWDHGNGNSTARWMVDSFWSRNGGHEKTWNPAASESFAEYN